MASLPSQHPSLALHLTDRALNPILTSAHSQSQLEALTSLTTTSLTAQAAANRFSLGPAQRIIVEHGPGRPVVLASFLNGADALPNAEETSASASAAAAAAAASNSNNINISSRPVSSSAAPAPTSAATVAAASAAAASTNPAAEPAVAPSPIRAAATSDMGKAGDAAADAENAAPMLVGVVVAATGEEAMEARRAAGRLERVGREFQREWAAEEGSGDPNGGSQ